MFPGLVYCYDRKCRGTGCHLDHVHTVVVTKEQIGITFRQLVIKQAQFLPVRRLTKRNSVELDTRIYIK